MFAQLNWQKEYLLNHMAVKQLQYPTFKWIGGSSSARGH